MSYRINAGYTREEAAEKLGISARTLASYERGEREINVTRTVKMAELYGTTFHDITDYKNIIKYIKEMDDIDDDDWYKRIYGKKVQKTSEWLKAYPGNSGGAFGNIASYSFKLWALL